MVRRILLAAAVTTGICGAIPAQAAEQCNGKTATIVGTSGDDDIYGTDGNDVISSLGGKDRIFARKGSDTICAGEGRDFAFGEGSVDWIEGAGGHDRLSGGKDDDRLMGGPGSDGLIGGPDDDRLKGGVGNDRFFAMREENSDSARDGDDDFIGGTGTDQVSFLPDPPLSWTQFPAVNANLVTGKAFGAGNDSLESISDLVALPGSTLVGDVSGNFLSVYGAGKIVGDGGPDILSGGDELQGDAGDDLFMSFITSSRPEDALFAATARGEIPPRIAYGGSGDDEFRGGISAEAFFAGRGADEIYGEDPDHFSGIGGADELHGGPGADSMEGNAGDDEMFGDEDDDVIDGGIGGMDYINGGHGLDLCTNGETTDNCEPIDP
jgi:Ca2+-binding RTX toxin-like protein